MSPELPEEMLRVSIPVTAPALVWIAQHRRMFMGGARADFSGDTKDAISVGDKSK